MVGENPVLDWLGFLIGAGGFTVAVLTFQRSNLTRRKEALIPMIERFENCKAMKMAKDLLDNYVINDSWEDKDTKWNDPISRCSFEWDSIITAKKEQEKLSKFLSDKYNLKWTENAEFRVTDNHTIQVTDNKNTIKIWITPDTSMATIEIGDIQISCLLVNELNGKKTVSMERYYHRKNLRCLLRDYRSMPIFDDGEVAIRKSFDALLDFFVELEYLVGTLKIMKRNEAAYFEYYYRKAGEQFGVQQYVKTFEFNLNGILDPNLHK